ncbi:MAG: hypothetical protein SD837_05625 [Candidatus Electrothrix scaldis]|nr:MAG: hypothetical protein SD837_05625 [Candidatus Electrothrix sp. GW3-3]
MPSRTLHRTTMNNLRRLKELALKYKWIFSGLLAMIGFVASLITLLDHYERKQVAPIGLEKNPSTQDAASQETFYTVKLLLPARIEGAEILVDSQPAVIVQQTPTIVTVQVKRKTTGHQFTVRKGETACIPPPQLIRENNVIIHPCR